MPRSVRPFEGGSYIGTCSGNAVRKKSIPAGRRRGTDVDRAVLSQRQQGVEKVVAYASRKLSKCDINYCVTRKELLAVVYFVKYFKHYLQDRRFMVRTDHAALLREMSEPVGRQARWISFLEEFEHDIAHQQGKLYVNADALPRRPCRAGCCVATSASVVEQAKDTVVALSDENLEGRSLTLYRCLRK